jgi:dTDP-4-dehydrorhamnose 3,5-epimerase-like enzyme
MSRDWPIFKDDDGTLVPIEFSKLPFKPSRIFYVCDVPKGEERGMHAHYQTQQILTCIKGKILVRLHNGVSMSETVLEENDTVFIDKMTWDSQVFLTGNDVLLSICSTEYNIDDYIDDFDFFLKLNKE